jgi:serine/threonine-protein kinase
MGEVYRAHDARLNRDVAIKVLPDQFASDTAALARFKREAQAVAALSHPNILVLFDIGSQDGVTWVVTELLEGETLRERLDRGALSWRKTVEIGIAIAQGLAAAHAKGIVHRDIKPANIFITSDERVKILDFGLASARPSLRHDEKTASHVGLGPETTSGTLPYMSPEQIRGEATDTHTDLYSLGVVLYEAISDRRPFAESSAAGLMVAILREEAPPLAALGKQIPAELQLLIEQCLAKNPLNRLHSAPDLAFALGSVTTANQPVVEVVPAAPRHRTPRTRYVIISAIFVSILAAVGFAWFHRAQSQAIDSLAVLPFTEAHPTPDSDYLTDGITESLIGNLSQLPNLKVMSRSAVFRYKGKEADPRKAGRELGVKAVLIGHLEQRAGDLSITTELVNVDDDSVLWGERYERKLMDALAVQNDIAHQIVEKLRLRLNAQQITRMKMYQTASPEAYQLYLKGRYYAAKFDPVNLNKGRDYLRQAIESDPGFALAYDGLSYYYALLLDWFEPAADVGPKCLAAAQKALEIDPDLVEAHVELGAAHLFYDFDWPAAEREFKRAMELNPNYAPAHEYYAWYLTEMGRADEGLAEIQQAGRIDPLSPEIAFEHGWFLYYSRNYKEAVAQEEKALELDPNLWTVYFIKGLAYEQLGRFPEAVTALTKSEEILGDNPSPPLAERVRVYALWGRLDETTQTLGKVLALSRRMQVSKYAIATAYAGVGDKERAFANLDRAYDEHSFLLGFLKSDPTMDSLRSDRRFDGLLQRMKLK